MKKLFKTSIIFITPFLFILIFIFSLNINIHDWKHGHLSYNMQPRSINWFLYKLELGIKKLSNSFVNNKEAGLPTVNLIIPEKSSRALLSNIPTSTKKWVKAYYKDDNNLKEVQIRNFGDNPYNYMFAQKSIRLKTKKREMFGRQRYYEYQTTQGYILKDYTAKKIAKRLGLLVSDVRLVELYINGHSSGIYIERDRLNENFLRRNKIMPINLYKGETQNNENKIGLDNDLYNNSGLWSKVAYFNYMKDDDKSDLSDFLNRLRKAENSIENLNKIFGYTNADIWSNASIFETLIQGQISNHHHNARLALDPWSGKVYLIPHDVLFNSANLKTKNIVLDESNNLLFQILNGSSDFINLKYTKLFDLLDKDRILSKEAKLLEKLKPKILTSQKRDIGLIQQKYYEKTDNKNYVNKLDQFINSLKLRENTLLNILKSKPKTSWDKHSSGFFIKIDKKIPVSNLNIKFKNSNPKWVAIDINNNFIFDEEDKLFYPNSNSTFFIPVSLYANRIKVSNQNTQISRSSSIETANTKFKFFVENKMQPNNIIGINPFSKETFIISKNIIPAVSPTIFNRPIINNLPESDVIKTFSGIVNITNDLIISDITKILPGTIFKLTEGSSLIFNKQVIAKGTPDKPIIFMKSNDNNKPWGTVAIHGKGASNSVLKNLIIEGGSGDKIDNITYVSMLSLHDTENIRLENLTLKENFIYDDMLHIIYCNKITIENSIFESSKFDSIDIDISKNININNIIINNSGNDAIDTMESEVNIYNSFLYNSKDKGISVGENSNVKVIKTILKDNDIGLASKDNSFAMVSNSLFDSNNFQLEAYSKNLQYGAPGTINLNNSKLIAKQNIVTSKDNAVIIIKKSEVQGDLKKTGKVKIIE